MNDKRIPTVVRQHKRFLYLLVAVSLVLGIVGPAQVQAGSVTLDGAVSHATANTVSSIDIPHTTGTGTDRLMLVGVSWNCGGTARSISSVTFTYDTTEYTLTEVRTEQTGSQARYAAIYSLLDPPSGETGTVTVNFSGSVSNGIVAGVANFAGVDQTTPLGSPAGANANSTAPSVDLTGLNGDELVFDNVFQGASGSSQTLTVGADQTELTGWNDFIGNARAAASTEQATGASVTMSWTAASSSYWAIVAVPINPGGEDTTAPTVTIDQAAGQADPTSALTINFTVEFSESVADFATGDLDLSSSTAPGTLVGTVTEVAPNDGTTYNVAVSGMTGSGTVIASIAAGVAHDGAGNPNEASTSTDNTVTYNLDTTDPTVTIDQAAGQTDPTGDSPINFTVVFNEPVADFATGDVDLSSSTAPGTLVDTVTEIAPNDGTTYNVAVSGMTGSGDVIASIAAGAAHDEAGNPNEASTSTDNTVAYEYTAPTISYIGEIGSDTENGTGTTLQIPVGAGGVAAGDTIIVGIASRGNPNLAFTVTDDDGNTYTEAIQAICYQQGRTHMFYGYVADALEEGDNVTITRSPSNVSGGMVAVASVFRGLAETSVIDQVLEYPTGSSTTVQGNNPSVGPVTTTQADELIVGAIGTQEAVTAAAGDWDNDFETGPRDGTEGSTYEWTVSLGYKIVSAAGDYTAAKSGLSGDPYYAAAIATFKGAEEDTTDPTVTIDQAAGQADPTSALSVSFTVEFSEPVADFATGDVTLSGTAGATTAEVTGSGTTYNVAVSGMTGSGDVVASIAAGVAHDAADNPNEASTSTDNTVTYNLDITDPTVTIDQASGQVDPTGDSPINFTVVFNEPVADFATGDVDLSSSTAPGTLVDTVTEIAPNDGTTYNVAVSGMTGSGDVIASIAAGAAHDEAGNPNEASTSTDNTVAFEYVAPAYMYRVNCGGDTLDMAPDPDFQALHYSDLGAIAGLTVSNVDGERSTTNVIDMTNVDPSLPMTLFQTVLYNDSGGTMTYEFQVPNGDYDVLLHHAEHNFSSAGSRIFDIFVEGVEVLPDYDPFVAAGGQNIAVTENVGTTVSDGALTIEFVTQTSVPVIRGIEIVPAAAPTCYALTLGHTGSGTDPVADLANSTGCPTDEYVAGETINLSGAVAATGWGIASWYGTGDDTSTADTNSVTMPASAHAAGVNYLRLLGDVDMDGDVTSTDALIVLTADAGLPTTAYCPMNYGDVNGDGVVNSTDALIILTYDVELPVGGLPVGQPVVEPVLDNQPPGCGA